MSSADNRAAPRLLEDSFTSEQLNARKVEAFYNNTGTTIPAGSWVTISTDTTYGLGNSMRLADSGDYTVATDGGPSVLGVVQDAVVDDAFGDVVTYGVVQDAVVDAGLLAFEALGIGATAGAAAEATVGTDFVIGVALEDEGGTGAADVFVKCR